MNSQNISFRHVFRRISIIVFVMVQVLSVSLGSQENNGERSVAGDGTPGFSDVAPIRFNKPIRLAPYGDNAILVADIYNHAIRIVTLDGRVKTIAGGPEKKGHRDGSAGEAEFDSPHGVAYDPTSGEIIVAEAGNHTIRRLVPADPDAVILEREYVITTLAGVPGEKGYRDGKAAEALFSSPHAVAYLPDGGIVSVDIGNARIRLIQGGEVSTIAGTGEKGQNDGAPGEATFHYPMDLVPYGDHTIYIADAGTHRVRRLTIGKEVTTLKLDSELHTPHGISIDDHGVIYIADMNAHQVVSVDKAGKVSNVCGTGVKGLGEDELNRPAAVLVHGGNLWIADLDNHRIKVIPLTD